MTIFTLSAPIIEYVFFFYFEINFKEDRKSLQELYCNSVCSEIIATALLCILFQAIPLNYGTYIENKDKMMQ